MYWGHASECEPRAGVPGFSSQKPCILGCIDSGVAYCRPAEWGQWMDAHLGISIRLVRPMHLQTGATGVGTGPQLPLDSPGWTARARLFAAWLLAVATDGTGCLYPSALPGLASASFPPPGAPALALAQSDAWDSRLPAFLQFAAVASDAPSLAIPPGAPSPSPGSASSAGATARAVANISGAPRDPLDTGPVAWALLTM